MRGHFRDYPHAKLIWAGLAPSTRRTYESGINKYVATCHSRHPPLDPWPATFDKLSCFISVHAWGEGDFRRLPHHTIRKYLSAIRSVHVDMNLDTAMFNTPHLNLLVQGACNLFPGDLNTSGPTREPLSRDLLLKLVSPDACHGEPPRDTLNLNAAFCLAFAGFLRMGEFTWSLASLRSPGFSRRHLTHRCVTMESGALSVVLPFSKTDIKHQGIRIPIAATNDGVCPVFHMSRIIQTEDTSLDLPLFSLQRGCFSRAMVLARLKARLLRLGLPVSNIKGHSFRKGAAMHASQMGASTAEIKALGRWESDAVERYYDGRSAEHLLSIQQRIHAKTSTTRS